MGQYNTMMQKYIVANWKMNGTRTQAHALATTLATQNFRHVQIILCPPFCYLPLVGNLIHHAENLTLGAQNCHAQPKGAFTGEIAAPMLADLGVTHVILGHSERRQHAGETNVQVCEKVVAAQDAGLTPIVCVGETQMDKELGHTDAVLIQQIQESIPQDFKGIIAYEPVWAIGTGQIPDLNDIIHVHTLIQEHAPYPILYGGSVNGANAQDILGLNVVDGVLVGGASLDMDQFTAIIHAAP